MILKEDKEERPQISINVKDLSKQNLQLYSSKKLDATLEHMNGNITE